MEVSFNSDQLKYKYYMKLQYILSNWAILNIKNALP